MLLIEKNYLTKSVGIIVFLFGCVLFPLAAYSQSVTLGSGTKGAGPVAYWNFDDSGGPTAYDKSGNGNNGTLNAGAGGSNTSAGMMWSTQGKYGGAMEFDGTDDYVETSAFQKQSNQKTICAWVKPANQSGLKGLVIHEGAFYLRLNNMKLEARVYNNAGTTSNTYDSVSALAVDQWSFVCEVIDGSTTGPINLKFYINGKLDLNQDTNLNGIGIAAAGTNYLKLGNDDDTTGRFFNGLIDEVRVYNRALSAAEVQMEYAGGAAAHIGGAAVSYDPWGGNPPIGWWSLDENSGTTAYDRSGSGKDGTITDAGWTHGKYGQAISFNGTSTRVSLGTVGGYSTAVTVEAWVKHSSTSDWDDIVAGGCGDLLFAFSSNTLSFCGQCNSPFTCLTYTTNINGAWHHVAGVYDSATTSAKIYVDGILVNSGTKTGSFTPGPLSIGSTGGGGSEYFSGLIDDVKIYNYARTAAQVAWDYNKGKPMAWWKFDEATSGSGVGTSNIKDSSGNDNHGSGSGSNIAWTTGKYGGALSFNGTNDYVLCTNAIPFGTSPFTVGLWIKATGTSTYNALFDEGAPGDSSHPGYQMFLSSGLLRYNMSDGAGHWQEIVVGGSPDLRDDKWHYVVWTYDGSNSRFYLDTSLLDTDPWTYGTGTPTAAFKIATSWVDKFNGLIDDVRIYNYARTADQIKQDYNEGAGAHLGK